MSKPDWIPEGCNSPTGLRRGESSAGFPERPKAGPEYLERRNSRTGACDSRPQEWPPGPRSGRPKEPTRLGRSPGDHTLFAASAVDEGRRGPDPQGRGADRHSMIARLSGQRRWNAGALNPASAPQGTRAYGHRPRAETAGTAPARESPGSGNIPRGFWSRPRLTRDFPRLQPTPPGG